MDGRDSEKDLDPCGNIQTITDIEKRDSIIYRPGLTFIDTLWYAYGCYGRRDSIINLKDKAKRVPVKISNYPVKDYAIFRTEIKCDTIMVPKIIERTKTVVNNSNAQNFNKELFSIYIPFCIIVIGLIFSLVIKVMN